MTTLNDLLRLERPLFVIDLETTGVDPATDRIVEFAYLRFGPNPNVAKEAYSILINPGVPIPAAAVAVHDISDGDVASAPRWSQLAASVARGFTNCDFAGKNVRFDLKLLSAEMARANVAWSYEGARIVDADRVEQLLEPRDLTSLYKRRLGKDLVDAHGALTDCHAVAEVLVAQLDTQKLPLNLDLLHKKLWPGWIDDDGKFKFYDGEPCVAFGKHRGKPMRQVPRGYFDWICKGDFSPMTKAIAERAARGEYPQP